MIDKRKISISIPTWNRYQMTIDSFAKVIDDKRIESVNLVDDCSTDASCQNLVEYFKGNEKVKIRRNNKNLDCYRCKAVSVSYATTEFLILLDSDNTIDTSYIDALYAIHEWDKHTFYLPEFARPHFSATRWTGLTITSENVAQYADTHLFTNLNAMNFFVNRDEFLRVWDGSVEPNTSDSIYFSYCWLKAGNKIFVTPNLQYDHYISPNNDGHYQLNQHKGIEFYKELMNKMRAMR